MSDLWRMRFIKKYESIDLRSGSAPSEQSSFDIISSEIYNIFPGSKYYIDVYSLEDETVYIRSNKIQVNIMPNRGRLTTKDIEDKLYQLSMLGIDYSYTLYGFVEGKMESIKARWLGSIINYAPFECLVVQFSLNSNECPNPECDNILENPDEKCPICGE